MADVFVSYSRHDQGFVRGLHDALMRRGREAWVDWDGIRPSEEFMRAILAAIESADAVVFVVSPQSVASAICAQELAHADAHHKRIVPVVVRDVDATTVPLPVAKLNWIFCRERDDFERGVDALITALDTDIEWIHAHTRLLTRAIEWDTKSRNQSFVLRGIDLRDAEQWLTHAGAEKERQPTALQTEYIIASRKGANRRQRILLSAVTAGLVVASVLAVLALLARREADRQALQARLTSVQADVDAAQLNRQASTDVDPLVLAHLARALRTMPEATSPRMVLASILANTSWTLPAASPLPHGAGVTVVRFSPDGRRLLTGSADGNARVWDVATGRPLTMPLANAGQVTAVDFSPDGRRIVTGSGFGGSAKVWDAETGQPIGEPLVPPGEGMVAVHFSPDGTRILAASFAARVWDLATRASIGEAITHGDALTAASLSTDGTQVVTGARDYTARVWAFDTGRPLTEPLRHQGPVTAATFSGDQQWVLTASEDGTARVWDAHDGRPLLEPMRHDGPVLAARFSADGARAVTASADQTARLWDARTGKPVGQPMRHGGRVMDARFSPDDRWIITASEDGTARVWSAHTGAPHGEPLRHGRAVLTATFSPDSQLIATASADHTAQIWALAPAASAPLSFEHAAGVSDVAFSPDGRLVVTVAAEEHRARLWRVDSGAMIGEPLQHGEWVWTARFSPDGQRVVTASNDRTARVWSADTGKAIGKPLSHADRVLTASFNPDGSRIVTASLDKMVRVWDASTGQLVRTLPHSDSAQDARFTPDGRQIVTRAFDKTIRIWNAADGTPMVDASAQANAGPASPVFSADGEWIITPRWDFTAVVTSTRAISARAVSTVPRALQHEAQIESAAFAPDARRVVTTAYDRTARIWDTLTGNPVGAVLRHIGTVWTATYSADGALIVTGGDRLARVWDAESGRPLGEPLRHDNDVRGATFSGDWARLLTRAGNTARVWDVAVDIESPLPPWVPELAEGLAGRRFNEQGVLVPAAKTVIDLRPELLALTGGDLWSKLGRWFFLRGPERTISPNSTVAVERFRPTRTAEAQRTQ